MRGFSVENGTIRHILPTELWVEEEGWCPCKAMKREWLPIYSASKPPELNISKRFTLEHHSVLSSCLKRHFEGTHFPLNHDGGKSTFPEQNVTNPLPLPLDLNSLFHSLQALIHPRCSILAQQFQACFKGEFQCEQASSQTPPTTISWELTVFYGVLNRLWVFPYHLRRGTLLSVQTPSLSHARIPGNPGNTPRKCRKHNPGNAGNTTAYFIALGRIPLLFTTGVTGKPAEVAINCNLYRVYTILHLSVRDKWESAQQ